MNAQEQLQLLMDEREIIRLVNRFDRATNLRDAAAFAKLWTEDAVWEISKPIYTKAEGWEKIVAMRQYR